LAPSVPLSLPTLLSALLSRIWRLVPDARLRAGKPPDPMSGVPALPRRTQPETDLAGRRQEPVAARTHRLDHSTPLPRHRPYRQRPPTQRVPAAEDALHATIDRPSARSLGSPQRHRAMLLLR
jgi:hypothetical protein